MPIIYSEENLFSIPGKKPAPLILAHGCNCQGVWGRGIAAEFRTKYPEAYQDYHNHSRSVEPNKLLGTARLFEISHGVYIASLYTSVHYREPDTASRILSSTARAVLDLLTQAQTLNATFYSNKFNSGLFRVKWEETEAVLETIFKDKQDVKWVVCTPPEFQP